MTVSIGTVIFSIELLIETIILVVGLLFLIIAIIIKLEIISTFPF